MTSDGSALSTPSVGSNGTVTVTLPTPYVNAVDSGDDTLTLQFDTMVLDTGSNARSGTKSNRSTINWKSATELGNCDQLQRSRPLHRRTPPVHRGIQQHHGQISLRRVRPLSRPLRRSPTRPHRTCPPATNSPSSTGARRHRTHQQRNLVADGGSVDPDGGTWNATARTITWNATTTSAKLTSLAPAGSTSLTYSATVDNPGHVEHTGEQRRRIHQFDACNGDRRTVLHGNRHQHHPDHQSHDRKDGQPHDGDGLAPRPPTRCGSPCRHRPDKTATRSTPCPTEWCSMPTTRSLSRPDRAAVRIRRDSRASLPTANGNGTTSIGWWFGDVTTPAAGACQYLLTFDAHVAANRTSGGAAVVAYDLLVNSVQLAVEHLQPRRSRVFRVRCRRRPATSSTLPVATATFTVQEPTPPHRQGRIADRV
ncbi:MAG: hypothetical protein R2710_27150 [Acidimicrobiales bacterium]